MYKKSVRLLLVDDDEDDFFLTKDLLNEIANHEFRIDWISTYSDAIKEFAQKRHDVYFIDYRLGKNTGLELLQAAINAGCEEPIIMLTGKGDQKIDEDAMKIGAADYLVKDKIDKYILERTIRYAMERSQTTKALKESELKYRNIFEKSRDVIYITNREGRFIDINYSATKLFGYTQEELLNLNAGKLYANEQDRKIFEETIARKGELTDFEVTLLTKTGEKIFCLLTSTIQHSDDSEVLYQGIIHDITKRKKAEQVLMNTEKLAVTGRIARTIAHEVRNPLTNVFLSLEQLKNEVKADDDLDMYFDIINRNCERINQLITELLNSAKPAQLQFSKHSINDILDESLELAKDRIKLKEITIEKNYAENICDVYIDAEKVRMALLNILINAIEAMEPGKGHLVVTTSSQDNKCVITIRDNGAGIGVENINKLFEPFFSGKPKGMGLGLTTAQNIILNHKGTIEVESELNRGTQFMISFDTNALERQPQLN
jgi:PAS domain S-box-containing protein